MTFEKIIQQPKKVVKPKVLKEHSGNKLHKTIEKHEIKEENNHI